jgi:ribosome maturation factor RimP
LAKGKDQYKGTADRVTQVALPLCESENFELVHVEVLGQNRERVVRLFVDKPGGITLDDCVFLSRQLGDLIDVQIEDIGSYRLEVSSPGPNRPLKKKEDFHRFKGSRIKIETHETVNSQKKFTGILETVNESSVTLQIDGNRVEISDLLICKAKLAGE